MEDWAKAAVDALMTFDQTRFEAVIAVLDHTQLSTLAAQLQAADNDSIGAFDSLLYRAGSAMCDVALKERLARSYDANGACAL